MKKKIIKITIIVFIITSFFILIAIPCMGTDGVDFKISLNRYSYSKKSNSYEEKQGYAINGSAPVYQILSVNNFEKIKETNFYSLNANNIKNVNNDLIRYNQKYDLINQKNQIENLSNTINSNDRYYKQILWLLENMYVPDNNLTEEENLLNKQLFLSNAGIVANSLIDESIDLKGYKYIPKQGYDYSNFVSDFGKNGYIFADNSVGKYVDIVLSDELIQVVEQSAIWYFTNYLNNNIESNDIFNVYQDVLQGAIKKNWLNVSKEIDNLDIQKWQLLKDAYVGETGVFINTKVPVGEYLQEQASILCNYLIDSANYYAEKNSDEQNKELSINSNMIDIKTAVLNEQDYYIIGPIQINQYIRNCNLTDFYINDSKIEGAYISDINGAKIELELNDVIGKEFYISVPKEKILSKDIIIKFKAKINYNEKILWVNNLGNNNPIVQLIPKNTTIEVQAKVKTDKCFDLAVRNTIIKITDEKGNSKELLNEDGKSSSREINIVNNRINL